VSDLVEGLVRLLESDLHEPVNIGNPEEWTVLRMAESIRTLSGTRAHLAFHPLPVDDPKVRQPDISIAKKALGWEPRVPIESGLAATLEDFRARLRRTEPERHEA
jgi:nucleoside-diphosphate-sugar epimerase